MPLIRNVLLILVLLFFASAPAGAKVLFGTVLCDADGNGEAGPDDNPLVGVVVDIAQGAPVGSVATDAAGDYFFNLSNAPAITTVSLDASTLPADATIIDPVGGQHVFDTDTGIVFTKDFLIDSEVCRPPVEEGECWLTAGGAQIDADRRGQPDESFGGNVYPSCSPEPGDGGQWNHLSHASGLHVLGQTIQVIRCGNVPGIEPGSESPVTGFNFIEFSGTGRLSGVGGNRIDTVDVHFFVRAEDRNEPGNQGGQPDAAEIDRYFIHAFTDEADPIGSTVLVVDGDGNANTVDPVLLDHGNFQLHATSCDD